MPLAPFVFGFAIGAGIFWYLYHKSRSRCAIIDEECKLAQQEKLIVVDFMHNLVEAIGKGVERNELFDHIVHAAVMSTGGMSAAAFETTPSGQLKGVAVQGLFPPQRKLSEKQSAKLVTRAKFIEEILKTEVFEMGEGLIGSVAKSGMPILLADATDDPRLVQHEDSALRLQSIIVAPIQFRDKRLGVLAVANPIGSPAFSETDFSLVCSLAEQSAMAINNADLMRVQIEKNKLDFDISLASSIQAMLLPDHFPQVSRLDIDAFYRPAQKIGGDLYDIFELDQNRIAVVVADVSGKGVPASILMAICQTNLRHYARRYDSPSEILCAMNSEMVDGIRKDMFITIVFAIIDTEAEELTLSRAGHEQPLLLQYDPESNDYAPHSVSTEGMALGMVPAEIFDMVIAEKTIPFRPHDIFVLYTDGVTEAANAEGLEYGTDRLGEAIKTLRDRSAHELNEALVTSVERFSGRQALADDLTLLTIKNIGG